MYRLRVFALFAAGLLCVSGCALVAPGVGKLNVDEASYLVLSTPHRGPRDTLNVMKATNIASLNDEGGILDIKILSGFAYAAHDYRDGITLIGSRRESYAVKINQDGSYKMIQLDFSSYKIAGPSFWNVKIIGDNLYAGTINGAIQSDDDVVTRLVIFNDAGEILSFHEAQGFLAGLADVDGGVYWIGRESEKDDLLGFAPDKPFVVFKWDRGSRELSEVARIAPGDNKYTTGWCSSDGSIIRCIGQRRLLEGETEKGPINGSVGISQMIIDELNVKNGTRLAVDTPYSPDQIVNTPSGTIVTGLGNLGIDDNTGGCVAYRYDENLQVTGKVVLSEDVELSGVMSMSLVGDEIIGILGGTGRAELKDGMYLHASEIFRLNHKTMKVTHNIALDYPEGLLVGRQTLIPINKNLTQQYRGK